MKNKKRNLIIFSTFIILVVGVYLLIPKTKEEESNKTKPNVNTNGFLTLMLEQDDGTYKKSSASTWPQDGYVFNETLSRCENGSILAWEDEYRRVVLSTSVSDKCYVYFDKINSEIELNLITKEVTEDNIIIGATLTGDIQMVNQIVFNVAKIGNPSNDDEDLGDFVIPYSNEAEFDISLNNYVEISDSNRYRIRAMLYDDNDQIILQKEIEASTLYYGLCETNTLSCDIISNSDESNGLYYHDDNLAYSAQDRSYRYAGTNPDNYVCFGSDETICPADNLYRIIGVFGPRVKLIKNSDIGSYYYGGVTNDTSGDWETSSLNIDILNGTYLNSLGSFADMIDNSEWYAGKYMFSDEYVNVYNSKEIFSLEYTQERNYNNSILGKVGMLYLNEFGFAADPSNWEKSIQKYDANSNNWLVYSNPELSITPFNIRVPDDFRNYPVSYFFCGNSIMNCLVIDSTPFSVRPTFYLKPNVKLISGDGTNNHPYRIA